MDLARWLGTLHPKLVQFPLVLLLAGLLFDAVGWLRRGEKFHWAAKILTAAGTMVLLVAFICGIWAEVWAGRAGIPQHPIEWHEFLANVSSWGFVVLAAWRIFLTGAKRRALAAYLVIGLGFYVLLGLTAYLGGRLVFDYGAAVATLGTAGGVLSLHDLNTLATRQTDLNLKYSEMMHHIFGWMTLALSGSLLAQALVPERAQKVKWVGPTLLLLGGVFLFFFADLDLYRLFDPRQLRDREVQLHKTIATIMAIAGIAGLRRKGKALPPPPSQLLQYRRGSLTVPVRPAVAPAGNQSKLVAVLALIGGGMLFTHVHTVAPYANVAAGVYVAHVTLGLVALAIGATRLLQDYVPRHQRGLAVLFAFFMCVESVLLITYNEGLPWYIGYGHYNRWGPHGGTVAPFGSTRAELTFDEANQNVDVYLFDRMKDAPTSVPAKDLNVLISRGYEEIAIPVHGDGSHFTGPATALKAIPAFSARLELPHGSGTRMGYFDPWVTPAIAAIPPNEVAKFYCPMHEGMRSEKPGDCPLCGMPLIDIPATLPTTLHDDDFAMKCDALGQGRQRHLTMTPLRNGQTFHDLAVVHEKLLHLIVVSQDLTFFDHVHPVLQDDGSFQMDYTFPREGSFLLFADVTPKGRRSQVFRTPVTVGGASSEASHLVKSPAGAGIVEQDSSVVANLITSPRSMAAGIESYLTFHLSAESQPVTDLEPYLGAMGHCVVISEDGQHYLHCHPEQLWTPKKDARGGPAVTFHTVFPHAGKWKVWGQFQRHGKVIVSSFVVDVETPWLPPKVINFILND